MKKKLVPVLVVLALVIVGAGGYLMGQRSNNPVVETPPAQSSTPEVTPDGTPEANPVAATSPEPAPEPVSPEPSVEPVPDAATELSAPQEQLCFKEVQYIVYVKSDYMGTDGVPVFDRYKIDVSLGFDGLQKEVFRTSNQRGFPYFCVGVGYDDAAGYIQILDPVTGEKGYTNAEWFTQELGVAEVQKPVENQKPAEQKPADTQKPAEQKPSQGSQGGSTNNQGSNIDEDDLSGEYYTPENSDRTTIPEEQQTHDGGESGWSEDLSAGREYTGKISG